MPELSIILLTPDNFETIRRTIHCLSLQTAKDRMEIVIVAPSAEELKLDPSELQGFEQYRIVEIGKIDSIGSAYAAGVRKASGRVIALSEEHSFPQKGWAEALLLAHQKPWAAVGPTIGNANPDNLVSWADLYIGYGTWLEPIQEGIVSHLPGHNSSYKRDLLLEYGSALEPMMEAESILHWDLVRKGHKLYLQPAAKTLHTNFARIPIFFAAQFYNGRQFAASRAQNESWSFSKKIFYSAASPLIPLVRFWRILKNHRAAQKKEPFLRALPALLAGLIVDGAGQLIGFTFGDGQSARKMVELEFHRIERNKKRT
jgi:hypothetical protein